MGSGEEGKWWWREVLRKGSGDDGKWWGREVVTEGSDDEGEWWGRQVGTMGGGEEGKWWGREVDDGMWWRWEVVRKGSGDEVRWWRWEVVRKGSGDEGKWWVGEEAGARNLVFFRVKWLQPAMAMKGTSSVRRLRFGSFRVQSVPPLCSATSGCSCVRSSMPFLESVVADRIGMAASLSSFDVATCVDRCRFATGCCETQCHGCMNVACYVSGRKPEHETVYFSV